MADEMRVLLQREDLKGEIKIRLPWGDRPSLILDAKGQPTAGWIIQSGMEKTAGEAALPAIAGHRAVPRAMAVLAGSLHIKTADLSRTFDAEFTVGREGTLIIDDEFVSTYHARFQVARGQWFVEDLGSTNGTWLNGRRIRAAQPLKRGDEIKIGHTIMTVGPA